MPITWRNITAPDFSNTNNLMESGLDRIQQAGAGFKQMGQEAQARAEDQWQRGTERNTNNYLAQIAGATDMDCVEALRASLNPTQLNDTYNNQINSLDVMKALQDQGRFVRQDTMEQGQLDDFNSLRGARDTLANVDMITQTEGAEAGLAALRAAQESGLVQPWMAEQYVANIRNVGIQDKEMAMRLESHGWNRSSHAMRQAEHNWKNQDRITAEANRRNTSAFFEQADGLSDMIGGQDPLLYRRAVIGIAENLGVDRDILNAYLNDSTDNFLRRNGSTEEVRSQQNRILRNTVTDNIVNVFNNEGVLNKESITAAMREILIKADPEMRERIEEEINSQVDILNKLPLEEQAKRIATVAATNAQFQSELDPILDRINTTTTEIQNLTATRPYLDPNVPATSWEEAYAKLANELGLADKGGNSNTVNNQQFQKFYRESKERLKNDLVNSVNRINKEEGKNLPVPSDAQLQVMLDTIFKRTLQDERTRAEQNGLTLNLGADVDILTNWFTNLPGGKLDRNDFWPQMAGVMREYVEGVPIINELNSRLKEEESTLENVQTAQSVRRLQLGL